MRARRTRPGALIAVEVVEQGRAYRAMADPIALAAALGLPVECLPDVAEFCRELADAAAIAVTARTEPPTPPAEDDDYVEIRVDGEWCGTRPRRHTRCCVAWCPAR